MAYRDHKSAETAMLDQVRGRGGTMTIDFRTDDVQNHMIRVLNKLVDSGRLKKSMSDNHLVHTFTLPTS